MSESHAMELNGYPTSAPHAGPHVVPGWLLLAVFAALMLLTVVTVAVTWLDLGAWNLAAAMGIAAVKASLVALYFMHLRWDSPFYALLLVAALAFLALFLGFTLLDAVAYQPDIQMFREAQP